VRSIANQGVCVNSHLVLVLRPEQVKDMSFKRTGPFGLRPVSVKYMCAATLIQKYAPGAH